MPLSRLLGVCAALAGAALALPASMIAIGPPADFAPKLESTVLFTPRSLPGGISVPLPSILVTEKGTVLALCEFRRKGLYDFGHESDIVLRRSGDNGRTWGPVQVIYADPAVNAINGPIVQDRATGAIILTFIEVPASAPSQRSWVEYMARHGGSLWTTVSQDEGLTWSRPVETHPVGRPGWVAWPGNNSHGVQLAGGRLVITGMARHNRRGERIHSLDYSSCLLYSDDHGQSWQIGATTSFYGTDESAVALCSDGSLLVSNRINNRQPDDLVRLMTRSRDRGETYAETWMEDNMSLVHCHVGMLQWDDTSQGYRRHILAHCGPQGGHIADDPLTDRARLTIRLSYDDGRTWPVARQLFGPDKNTEYSDLALAKDGTILCLFTAHQHSLTGTVELTRFTLEEVESEYGAL